MDQDPEDQSKGFTKLGLVSPSKPLTPELKEGAHPAERRSLPRLNLTSEQFRHSQSGKLFPIGDLSKKGMALWISDPQDLGLFTVASVHEGTLNLRREKYPIKMKVMSFSTDRVGCEFGALSQELQQALRELMDPVRLGQELKPLPQSQQGGESWFHGSSGTELLFSRHVDGQYLRFSLFIFDSYVHWEEDTGLTTGRTLKTKNPSRVEGVYRSEWLDLSQDNEVAVSKLAIAKTVILSSNLAVDFKDWCLRKLTQF